EQRHNVFVVRQDVVTLHAEGPSGQLSLRREDGEDLILAPMVARERPPAREVEDNVVRQQRRESFHVALGKRVEALLEKLLVRVCHGWPPRTRSAQRRPRPDANTM